MLRPYITEAIIDHRELLAIALVAFVVALSIDLYLTGSPSILTFICLVAFPWGFGVLIFSPSVSRSWIRSGFGESSVDSHRARDRMYLVGGPQLISMHGPQSQPDVHRAERG